jgi:hypothetical protein
MRLDFGSLCICVSFWCSGISVMAALWWADPSSKEPYEVDVCKNEYFKILF